MSTFLYTRPSDILSRTATVAVNTGTGDAEYPPAYLVDGMPELPGKLTTTTGSWTFQMAGGAQRIDIAALIHANITAGLEVRIQGHTSNAWGAPTLNRTFTIPAFFADNFPGNPYVNLAVTDPVAANRTFEWWRVIVVGTNSAAISIGEVCLAQSRNLGVRNISWGGTRGLKRPSTINSTDFGVRYIDDFGTTIRRMEVETEATNTTRDDIENWMRSVQGRTFLIVPDTEVNESVLCHFEDLEIEHKRVTKNVNAFKFGLVEASRGLYP